MSQSTEAERIVAGGDYIKKLPIELLHEIFSAIQDNDDDDTPATTPLQDLVPLRQVARRWRDVVDNAPLLWTFVTPQDGPVLARMALKQSKHSGLTVVYIQQNPEDTDLVSKWCSERDIRHIGDIPSKMGALFWSMLNDHRNRWSEVVVNTDCVGLLEKFILPGEAPMLKNLSLKVGYHGAVFAMELRDSFKRVAPFGGLLPVLTELEIYDWPFSSTWGLWLQNLRELTLKSVIDSTLGPNQILDVLSRCPNLITLDLEKCILDETPASRRDGPPVELPVLQHLAFSGCSSDTSNTGIPFDHILEHLVLPPNARINIRNFSSPAVRLAMIRWIQRASPSWKSRGYLFVSLEDCDDNNYPLDFIDINAVENFRPICADLSFDGWIDEGTGIAEWYERFALAFDQGFREGVELIEVYSHLPRCGAIIEVLVSAFTKATTLRLSWVSPEKIKDLLAQPSCPDSQYNANKSWLFSRMTCLEAFMPYHTRVSEAKMVEALRQVRLARSLEPSVQTLEKVVLQTDDGRRVQVGLGLEEAKPA